MAGNTKDLRVRIKSVGATLQLTNAMGLVASSKIRRANEAMVKAREYYLTKAAEEKLQVILQKSINDSNFSNARLVRNIIEKAIRQQAYRLVQTEKFQPEDIINLSAEDFKMSD